MWLFNFKNISIAVDTNDNVLLLQFKMQFTIINEKELRPGGLLLSDIQKTTWSVKI
jgi:hypothetical protein